ncbi:MAG: CHC2 zinc finger domain-containing protein [Patescibacteria group bacterium]
MNSPVQKIKERLSIEEVVSAYIKLEKAGVNLKAKCPFHNEKTPSFFVSPSRGSYYCFGCSAGGDIFSFVEEFEGLDFKGALKLLADRAGVPLERYNSEGERVAASEKERLYKVMEESAQYFESNLAEHKNVITYLTSRGLTESSIKDFRIGFAQNDWRLLYAYLLKKGFSEGEMEKAGLIKKSEKGFYDRFRNRIMFPMFDSSGRIIAFSGRIFSAEGAAPAKFGGQGPASGGIVSNIEQAKYINSPETPIFNKSSVLYGIDRAKESIRKNNFSILVEGQMDLILSHQAGFKNTVASSGTALSDSTISKASLVDDLRLRENIVSNLGLIRRLSNNIVLAFDADRAGFNASSRAGKIALSFGMDVKVASIPEGIDPADLISQNGSDAWREAIRNSKHLIEFLLQKVLESAKSDSRKAGREIKEKVLPYVASLESSIEKMHFIKLISDQSSVPHSALEDDLKKIEQALTHEKKEVAEVIAEESKVFRKDYIERKLLGIIFWQKTLSEPQIEVGDVAQNLAEILHTTTEKLLQDETDNMEDLIFEAEVFYAGEADLKKDVAELLQNLQGEYLKEALGRKMKELHAAEEAKDAARATEILKECQAINDKIQSIKNNYPNK